MQGQVLTQKPQPPIISANLPKRTNSFLKNETSQTKLIQATHSAELVYLYKCQKGNYTIDGRPSKVILGKIILDLWNFWLRFLALRILWWLHHYYQNSINHRNNWNYSINTTQIDLWKSDSDNLCWSFKRLSTLCSYWLGPSNLQHSWKT